MNEIKKNPNKFINTLYSILQSQQYQQFIKWNEKGNGFTIYKRQLFQQYVMGKKFRTSNIQSFFRQLGMYGFKMQKNEKGQKEYCHKYFIRDDKSLLFKIQRNKNKLSNKLKEESLKIDDIQEFNYKQKEQLERLQYQQQILLRQLRINGQIQSLITEKVQTLVSSHINRMNDQKILKQYQSPMFLFFGIIGGYQPEILLLLLQNLQEAYPLDINQSPFLYSYSSPITFPFI